MTGEALIKLIMTVVLLMIPASLVLSIIFRIRNRRREELKIRLWCDAEGYAINRMRIVNTSLLATAMFWLVGWLCWWAFYRRGWLLTVLDSEGGEKTMIVRIRRDGNIEETSRLSEV
jgi:Gpi18-like mannosyltransferase